MAVMCSVPTCDRVAAFNSPGSHCIECACRAIGSGKRQRRQARKTSISMISLALTLQELRITQGLSQNDLARLSGLGMQTISSYETTRRIFSIKVSHLLAICAALKLTAEELFKEVARRYTA